MSVPLLGVAGRWGAAEIDLARRFDDLHQLLYRPGGMRPSNAAVEEVAKLVLIRLWSRAIRTDLFPSRPSAAARRRPTCSVPFAAALADPEPAACDPSRPDPPDLADGRAVPAHRCRPCWPPRPRWSPTSRPRPAAVADPLGTAFDALLAGRYDHAGGLGTYLTPSARRPDDGRGRGLLAARWLPRHEWTGPASATRTAAPAGSWSRSLDGAARPATTPARGRPVRGRPVARRRWPRPASTCCCTGSTDPLVWTVRDSVTDSDCGHSVGRVPLILTNPPFGEGKYDDPDGLAAHRRRPAPAGRPGPGRPAAWPAWSGRCALLAPGGVLGIVLPDGHRRLPAFADLVLPAAEPPPVRGVGRRRQPAHRDVRAQRHRGQDQRGVPAPQRPVPARGAGPGGARRLPAPGRPGRARPAGNELPTAGAGIGRPGPAGAATLPWPASAPLVPRACATRCAPRSGRLDPVALQARPLAWSRRRDRAARTAPCAPSRRARPGEPTPYVSVLHVDDLGTVDWQAARRHTPDHRRPPRLEPATSSCRCSTRPRCGPRSSRMRAAVPGLGRVRRLRRVDCDPYAIARTALLAAVRAQLVHSAGAPPAPAGASTPRTCCAHRARALRHRARDLGAAGAAATALVGRRPRTPTPPLRVVDGRSPPAADRRARSSAGRARSWWPTLVRHRPDWPGRTSSRAAGR